LRGFGRDKTAHSAWAKGKTVGALSRPAPATVIKRLAPPGRRWAFLPVFARATTDLRSPTPSLICVGILLYLLLASGRRNHVGLRRGRRVLTAGRDVRFGTATDGFAKSGPGEMPASALTRLHGRDVHRCGLVKRSSLPALLRFVRIPEYTRVQNGSNFRRRSSRGNAWGTGQTGRDCRRLWRGGGPSPTGAISRRRPPLVFARRAAKNLLSIYRPVLAATRNVAPPSPTNGEGTNARQEGWAGQFVDFVHNQFSGLRKTWRKKRAGGRAGNCVQERGWRVEGERA